MATPVTYIIEGGTDFADDITLQVGPSVTGPWSVATLVGITFLFSARPSTDTSLLDGNGDPLALEFNWSGYDLLVAGQPSGVTYLRLTNAQTTFMQHTYVGNWNFQVMATKNGFVWPVIQPGVIAITLPVSNRTS